MVIRSTFIALASAVLAACAVGPDYVRPDASVPERFTQDRSNAADRGAHNDEAAFWLRFGDPLLARLIDDALAANNDLRAGLARWDQALALARRSRFDRWPTITAEATAAHSRASTSQMPGIDRADRDNDQFDTGITAFWELDFFGRVRRQVEARAADVGAVEADLRSLQVVIVGELASTYFRLRGNQNRLEVARDNAQNQRESLRLVQARLDAGAGTELDTSRAQAQLAATQARLPVIETVIATDMHRIAVLTGRTPESLIETLTPTTVIAQLPDPVRPGTPGDLLRRRPDIAAAERRLAGASARIGVATADLFPRFTLGGLLGTRALDADDLFGRDSETRGISLGIDWSFLDAGRVRARIAGAEAGAAEQLTLYQQTVLLALEDVENVLARHHHAHRELIRLRDAATASEHATTLARVQFDGGLIEFLQVLDAERFQLEAQDRLAQGQAAAAVALAEVYRALGGGWPDRLPEVDRLAIAQD
jgi:NodT family efflux transporter outer membrane factor (OMF) lipoprotein